MRKHGWAASYEIGADEMSDTVITAFPQALANRIHAEKVRDARKRVLNQVSYLEATGDTEGLKLVMKEAMEAYERLTDE